MNWKQPIPTNLEVDFGKDYACQLLYRELIYRACNNKATLTLDNKKFVVLDRGQVLFGRKKWGEYLAWNEKFVQRKLDDLVQKYQKVSKQPSTNYTIVTIKDYESIVDLSNQCPSDVQAVSTSKIIKNNNNIVRERKKRPKKPQGVLSGKIPPLDYQHLYQIARDTFTNIEDVIEIDKQVRLSVEDGNKYNITNQVLTVERWVKKALDENKISVRNDMEDLVFGTLSPEQVARDKIAEQKLKVAHPELL